MLHETQTPIDLPMNKDEEQLKELKELKEQLKEAEGGHHCLH